MIHRQNLALASGSGEPGARHINLEAMMVSNPISVRSSFSSSWLSNTPSLQDSQSYYRWVLDSRCQNPVANVYSATQCAETYIHLPACLDAAQYALDFPSAQDRSNALKICEKVEPAGTNGRMIENVKIKVGVASTV